jgi:hypothetical protein
VGAFSAQFFQFGFDDVFQELKFKKMTHKSSEIQDFPLTLFNSLSLDSFFSIFFSAKSRLVSYILEEASSSLLRFHVQHFCDAANSRLAITPSRRRYQMAESGRTVTRSRPRAFGSK